MKIVIASLLLALCTAGAAHAQSAASAPETAASRVLPARNPALVAAENAKEPGVQRPEQRVIPQISIPLKSRTVPDVPSSAASVAAPGGVNDDAARCLALRDVREKAACERQLAASAPR